MAKRNFPTRNQTAIEKRLTEFLSDLLGTLDMESIQSIRAELLDQQPKLDLDHAQLCKGIHDAREEPPKRDALRQKVKRLDETRVAVRDSLSIADKVAQLRSLVRAVHARMTAPPTPAKQPRLKYELRPAPVPRVLVCTGVVE